MKVIFICKRYYTGKDVVCHRFGRLYELPTQLARLGHQVTVLCLDYRNNDHHKDFTEQFGAGSVCWGIFSFRSICSSKLRSTYKAIRASKPSVVIGSSDIPCLWLSKKLARRLRVPYIVDLYDNYESFGQASVPGFRRMLKSSIKSAGAVITVSSALKEKIVNDYAPDGPVVVMNNGIVPTSFFLGDLLEARGELGLPVNAKLIGTAGGLSRMKGLDTVYDAWPMIESTVEDAYLVLAGRADPKLPLPSGSRVIYLGELSEKQVGQLFRALDVGIIPAHDSAFGRYCFPQKLFEMVACGLPLVGANVGAITETLGSDSKMLFASGDVEGLITAVMLQLEKPHIANIKPKSWRKLVESVEPVMLRLSG